VVGLTEALRMAGDLDVIWSKFRHGGHRSAV